MLEALGLGLCFVVSSRMRKVPHEFHEALYVTLAVAIIFQLFLIGIPVVLAVYDSAGLFITLSLIVFFSDAVLVTFLFVPKIVKTDHVPSEHDSISSHHVDVSVQDGLRVDRVRERFTKFAEKRFLIENVYFLIDVETWENEYESKSVSWLNNKARAMAKIYIHEGSLLQVNVSCILLQSLFLSSYLYLRACLNNNVFLKQRLARIFATRLKPLWRNPWFLKTVFGRRLPRFLRC